MTSKQTSTIKVINVLRMSSYGERMVDDLALEGDEGRGKLRKCLGELQTCFDPRISEWGNPARVIPCDFVLNS